MDCATVASSNVLINCCLSVNGRFARMLMVLFFPMPGIAWMVSRWAVFILIGFGMPVTDLKPWSMMVMSFLVPIGKLPGMPMRRG